MINNIGVNKVINYIKSDELFKNSYYLMLASLLNASFGFLFWLVAAKIYSKEEIGLASALISSISLIMLISRMGLDQAIIKYFPEEQKSDVFTTATIITTFVSCIFGLIFIIFIRYFTNEFSILDNYLVIYMLFIFILSILNITGIAFIASRKSKLYFIQSIVTGSRLVFLFPLIFLKAIGIFISYGLSLFLALLYSIYVLKFVDIKITNISKHFLIKSYRFSFGNFFAGIFITAPSQLIPIIVVTCLGPEQNAYYYISFSIASILSVVSNATSMSLFVEGSHGESLRKIVIKSITFTGVLLIPTSIILYLFGGFILNLIGKNYIESYELLKLFIISTFFISIINIFYSIERVLNKIKTVILLSGFNFVLVVGISYYFMITFGLNGLGYAYILSNAVCCFIALIILIRDLFKIEPAQLPAKLLFIKS